MSRSKGIELPIAVWAIGEKRAMSERERRLTAAVYVQLPGVLEHVRREGCLPEIMPGGRGGGREIGLRLLVVQRGLDIELSEAEREVFEAIGDGDERPIPGERAVVLERARA